MALINDLLKKLPDCYNKDINGNISKLFQIITPEIETLIDTFNAIQLWRDIDNAQGKTLDRIGLNLGQTRGNLTDVQYRVLLKAKIKQSMSRGDINTVIELIATILNIDVRDVRLTEVYPAGLHLTIDIGALDQALLPSMSLIYSFVKGALAAGVSLETSTDGTFTLGAAASAPEYSATAGLSNASQQTGGYLGGIIT